MTGKTLQNVGWKLFDVLRQVRTTHHGDLEEYLILYALILADTYEKQAGSLAESETTAHRGGVNLLSVAEMTGIPRETVRRKIVKLIAAGSVARDDGLYHYVGEDGSEDIMTRIAQDLPSFRVA